MFNIIRLRETKSTNNYLKDMLKNSREPLAEGTVVSADYQQSGRGQMGNIWEAEDGKNLLFSMVLFPSNVEANQQFVLSKMVSLAVLDVLKEEISDVTVKWPNDIYWNDQKIAGILIENELLGSIIQHSVIGIGLNVNQEKFLGDAPNPVSMKLITGRMFDREELLKRIVKRLYMFSLRLLSEGIGCFDDAYRSSLYRSSGYHLYRSGNKEFRASIAEVEPGGHLVLETEDGKRHSYAFKEVSIVL
jgi:BirA family biotin operon repressor/biotin-[acetyl-CoA-carboxylase] ligase